MNQFRPMRGSTCANLPPSIKKKKVIIKIQNSDNKCFAWAVSSALREPVGLLQKISSYPYYNTVTDFTAIHSPVNLKDIHKEQNDISVNVYGIEESFQNNIKVHDVVGPLYLFINLYHMTEENANSHYCWINNLSRLVSSQNSLSVHRKYI